MREEAMNSALHGQTLCLGTHGAEVEAALAQLARDRFGERLWAKDPSLWKNDASHQAIIRNSLGWLDVVETMKTRLDELASFAEEARAAGFRHVVHMGMGGSSLAPLAFGQIVPPSGPGLPLTVLDTTDAATVLAIHRATPLEQTLFIVASKSGTTAEPTAFGDYFYHQVKALKGDRAGENFVAITDPGSALARQAEERGYRRTFLNFADIGGRYSALSYFGLVPAALAGIDIAGLLARAGRMMQACGPDVAVEQNPGIVLGAVLGALAKSGRDKVTFLVPPAWSALGLWLEQLIAESTGKEDTGILPVAGEPLAEARAYGSDRLFVHVRVPDRQAESAELEAQARALVQAGQPLVTIEVDGPLALGAEFCRWEVATAVAGALIGINPFDQPNVQESKDNTNRLLAMVRDTGKLPAEEPTTVEGSLQIYGGAPEASAADVLRAFFAQARDGDYCAILAYLQESVATQTRLDAVRRLVLGKKRLPATMGYGPRYLHSTGQLHKGGPNTGLFLVLTADDAEDAQIPGAPYTFGVFKRAQALGDLEALRQHGRRVLRVHLGADVQAGLTKLEQAIERALG